MDAQEPVFSSSSPFFHQILFCFVDLGCIRWSWFLSLHTSVERKHFLLINHFSSEKSSGTVTDSKISQEKIPTRLMKSRFKARSTHECNGVGWESFKRGQVFGSSENKILCQTFVSWCNFSIDHWPWGVTAVWKTTTIIRPGHPAPYYVPLQKNRTLIRLKDNEISIAAAMHFCSKRLSQAVSWERNIRPCIKERRRHVMHNEIFSDFGRQNNLSRPWIFNDAWSGLSRNNNEHRHLSCPCSDVIGGGAKLGWWDLWFDDEKAFAFIDSPEKFMQISYLSIPLIQKTEKAFCRKYIFWSSPGRKASRQVYVRWSTFYVSEIFVYGYIRRYRLLVCYV